MMHEILSQTAYHPRWLRQRVSTYWWLEKPSYFAFILRESTCMFVAWTVVWLLLLMWAVVTGDAAYEQVMIWLASPWVLVLNMAAFAFLVYHAVTFFQAAPQAMVVHLGRRRVPGGALRVGHYAAWVVASLAVWWLLSGV
jgi:fumarate reductase subunit C